MSIDLRRDVKKYSINPSNSVRRRKMRKLFLLLSLLVVASMLLAACGGAAPATEEAPEATEEAPSGPLSPYIGSGQLDGNGIPADFFGDIHIRKAFSYSFDFET